MKLSISKKLKKEGFSKKPKVGFADITDIFSPKPDLSEKNDSIEPNRWRYLSPVLAFLVIFSVIFVSLVNLQIVEGKENYERSQTNKLEIEEIPSIRGAILDRNGVKIAENIPSLDVTLDLGKFRNKGLIDSESLVNTIKKLQNFIGEKYWNSEDKGYTSLEEKVTKQLSAMNQYEKLYTSQMIIVAGVDNETAIQVKSRLNELPGVGVRDGFKRYYPFGQTFSHILGYTGDVYAEELKVLDYVDINDTIGKAGIEKTYDEYLIGVDGQVAREVDALGQRVDEGQYSLTKSVAGSNIYLTVDSKVQKKMFEVIKAGVKRYNATGGVGILQDVKTGEIISMVSYPSYDNNMFIGGISSKQFGGLLKAKGAPLNNKAIGAQVPPGSTFKTLVAMAALDSGAINTSTKYTSTSNYTFSNGAEFQEYHDHAYGVLDVVNAISVSSNIFFCETIRHWDMERLVPYLRKFGIGDYTYIDIPGEGKGMLPSPENKVKLAKTTSPWLDDVWYPEGDSCNSVIGQGITTVTPIQMSNWVAMIANGGTRLTPHIAKEIVDVDGKKTKIKVDVLASKVVKTDVLSTVKYGMWLAVNGPRKSIAPLSGAKVPIAAKTGTAEFGRLNSKGEYEHRHAWVTGFFPYDNPKYSFVVFLEDGGESYYSANVARIFLDWFIEYSK